MSDTSNQGERLVFGDTETTGFAHSKGDRIVEVALIETIDLRKTGRVLHFHANPDGRLVGDSEKVHGLSDGFLAQQAPFSDRAQDVVDFLDGAVFVAHNASFDMGFLEAELGRCGLALRLKSVIDTLAIARRKLPGSALSLDSLMSRFGVDSSRRVRHGALIDSELLIEVYAHLIGKTTLALEQSGHPSSPVISHSIEHGLIPDSARQSWFPVREPALASDDEFMRHMEMVEKKLKNAVWTDIFAESGSSELTSEA